MIQNASDVPLDQNSGTVPNMADTIMSWFQKLVFTIVTKTVVNFQVVETATDVNFLGVWQPLSPESMKLKPEGQRSWKWFQLHAHTTLVLNVDDVVKFLGVQYRVMSKLDYSLYGYNEYHIIEDWQGSGP